MTTWLCDLNEIHMLQVTEYFLSLACEELEYCLVLLLVCVGVLCCDLKSVLVNLVL